MIDEQKPLVPEVWYWRLVLILTFTLLPVVSFILADDDTLFVPSWQTDDFTDYVGLLFLSEVTWVFSPFLVYAALSMLLLMISPTRFVAFFGVRFGIYTGVVLSVHYALQLILATSLIVVIFVIPTLLVLLVAKWFYQWAVQQMGLRKTWLFIVITLLGWVGLGLIISMITTMFDLGGVLDDIAQWVYTPAILLFIGLLASGPVICLWLSIYVLLKLWQRYDDPLKNGWWFWPSAIAWLAAYGISWRIAVVKAMEVYATLPKNPPDCYIATAASQGHATFVKATSIRMRQGQVMQVNTQLQVLKGAELCLKIAVPNVHRGCRWVYDIVGRRLAQCLRYPLLADLAYLLLKPLECATKLAMQVAIPKASEHIAHIYRP